MPALQDARMRRAFVAAAARTVGHLAASLDRVEPRAEAGYPLREDRRNDRVLVDLEHTRRAAGRACDRDVGDVFEPAERLHDLMLGDIDDARNAGVVVPYPGVLAGDVGEVGRLHEVRLNE